MCLPLVAEEEWRDRLSLKTSLGEYRSWKACLDFEEFLLDTNRIYVVDYGRRQLIRFRGGVSGLRVDTERWENCGSKRMVLPRSSRKCLLCYSGVEDARHVLKDCDAYDAERKSLIRDVVTAGKSLENIVVDDCIVDIDEFLRRCLFGDCKEFMIKFLSVVMRKRNDLLQLRSVYV